MGSTYMTLTNRVLEKFNEIQLVESNFIGVTGIQGVVKNCVNDAINEINAQEFEWPFNAYEHTMQLGVGQEEYGYPPETKSVDWSSFQIQVDDTIGILPTTLRNIDRTQWYQYLKDQDEIDQEGQRLPQYVFAAHGDGFGVSPSPDKNYTLKFRYYKQPDPLVNFDDTTTIPSRFDQVIINGAVWYMYIWMDNADQADRMEKKFKENIGFMINQMVQTGDTVYVGTRNFGGGTLWASSGYLRVKR